MIPLHCLWTKSKNKMSGQFESDVTWFCLCFDFAPSIHGVVVEEGRGLGVSFKIGGPR